MWLYVIAFASTLVVTAFAQNATSAPASNSTIECFDGLKMFVSRGTSEPLGTGETGKVVEEIAARINGSAYEANPYPASGDNPNYFISVANGTAVLKKLVVEYAEACPGSKMALFGYSQVCIRGWLSSCGLYLYCDHRARKSPATYYVACPRSGLCMEGSIQLDWRSCRRSRAHCRETSPAMVRTQTAPKNSLA